MEYLLLILFTLGIGYGASALGPMWSQILFVPALYLSYKVGFDRKLGYYGEQLWGARFFFVLYIAGEVLVFYKAIAELLP